MVVLAEGKGTWRDLGAWKVDHKWEINSQSMETIKIRPLIIIAAIVVGLIFPLIVFAETVVRTGDSVSIGVNQVVENDFYAAGGSVTHSGAVKEDIYVVAGSITLDGTIGHHLTPVARTLHTNAPVADDVRPTGGAVVLSASVKHDVPVSCGGPELLSSPTITGYISFYGKEPSIEGVVG